MGFWKVVPGCMGIATGIYVGFYCFVSGFIGFRFGGLIVQALAS